MIIAGTPDQVIERLKYLVEQTRPGIMGIWGNDGTVSKEDRRRCIELLCGEVMPAIKEYRRRTRAEGPVGGERAGASAVFDGHRRCRRRRRSKDEGPASGRDRPFPGDMLVSR